MINTDMITFIIASFCQFNNPAMPKQVKFDCQEYMVNCIILQDGRTTNEVVNICREAWADIELRKRTGR